jgi:serine/threonine protein kinase
VAGTTETGEVRLVQRGGDKGQRQGRYVLGELLGRGGMAEVFAGHSLGSHGFQKPVAIKRLLPELANDHVFVERLIGEAKLLVGMQHGNIVSVLDLARDGDDVFLVMEFVDGPSLRQLLKARGQRGLPIGVATYIVQHAAQGLEFAHARPGGAVIHADISPSNLLLTTSGEVRVADFGIARREGGGAGIVEGKWAYMAPEQARGEPLTPRSDVFALGVVLYELIVGQHPLGKQITAEERDSAPVRVIPPRVVNPLIPPGIDAICMRALAHDPRERYSRMQQLIDALVEERFGNGWKEGANDLAQVIREITPGGASAGPKTQVTERPVTIITRSLISQPQRASSPRLGDQRGSSPLVEQRASSPRMYEPAVVVDEAIVPKIPNSDAQTRALLIPEMPPGLSMPPAMPMPAMPAMQMRPDGTPSQLLQLAATTMLPSPELASVHGGTFTGSAAIGAVPAASGGSRWTLGVFGVAAVIGVAAAIILNLGGGKSSDDEPPVVTAAVVQPPPAATPTEAPKPTPESKPTETKPAETAEVPAETKPAETETKPAETTAARPSEETTAAKPSESTAAKPAETETKPSETKPAETETKPAEGETMEARIARHHSKKTVAAATPETTTSKKSASTGDGFLRVDDINGMWAHVVVNNQFQDAPRARFRLPAGTYPMKVSNDDVRFTCKVTIEAGKTTTIKLSMGDATCE